MNALLLKHRSAHIKDGVNDWTHFLSDLHRPTDVDSDCEGPSTDQLKSLFDHEKLRKESECQKVEHLSRVSFFPLTRLFILKCNITHV